jgi:hypothetical protein
MSDLNIRGANISNGIFHKSIFKNTDLSNVIAKNCYFE